MRVLFLLSEKKSGFTDTLNQLADYEDMEISAVVPADKLRVTEKDEPPPDKLYNFKVHPLKEFRTWYGKTFFRNFKNTVREDNPDIVVFNWPYILALFFYPSLYFFLKRMHIKTAFRDIPIGIPVFKKGLFSGFGKNKKKGLHGITARAKLLLLTFARRLYYPRINLHLNYSDNAYEILTSYGVDHNKIFMIYNSPDTAKLLDARSRAECNPPLLPDNFDRIIYYGPLKRSAKIDLLLEAVSILAKKFPNIELVLAGSGPDEEYLDEIALIHDVKERVLFTGKITAVTKAARYALDSSVAVIPGTGGTNINELMAFEKPVIISEATGIERRLVFEDFNGLYFEKNDAYSLAEQIDVLLSDEEKVKQFGVNSGKIIKDRINIHTVLKGYYEAFRYVMGETGI